MLSVQQFSGHHAPAVQGNSLWLRWAWFFLVAMFFFPIWSVDVTLMWVFSFYTYLSSKTKKSDVLPLLHVLMLMYITVYTQTCTHTFDITSRTAKELSQHSKYFKTIWQRSRGKLSTLIHFFGFLLLTVIVFSSLCHPKEKILYLSTAQYLSQSYKIAHSHVLCHLRPCPSKALQGQNTAHLLLGSQTVRFAQKAEVAYSIRWEARNFLSVTVTFKSIRNHLIPSFSSIGTNMTICKKQALEVQQCKSSWI